MVFQKNVAIEQGANVQSRHGYDNYENSHKVHIMRWCRGKSLELRKTRNSEQADIFCKFCNGMWRLCNKTSKLFFTGFPLNIMGFLVGFIDKTLLSVQPQADGVL